jgi:hypothetical protein
MASDDQEDVARGALVLAKAEINLILDAGVNDFGGSRTYHFVVYLQFLQVSLWSTYKLLCGRRKDWTTGESWKR